jgi:hypothetical protein
MWWGVVEPARPPGNSMVFLLVSFVRHTETLGGCFLGGHSYRFIQVLVS